MHKWITGADSGIYFMAKPEYFRTIYVIMDVWKGAGFGSIIYTSALAGIDMELYGSSSYRRCRSVETDDEHHDSGYYSDDCNHADYAFG